MSLKRTALKFSEIAKKTPQPIKSILKLFGVKKLLSFISDKYTAELAFQIAWANEFKKNKDRVLAYWEKYRYLDDIKNICKFEPTTKILDVGCGISTVLHFIKGQRYGIDPLADEYKKSYTFPSDISIQKAWSENIPFQDNFFDVVFCTNALDHVTNPSKALSEIHRVLRKNGLFVLTIEIFKENIKRDLAHPHSMTEKDVERLWQEKFKKIFERESPWIGMRNFVNHTGTTENKELIVILEKA